MKIGVPRETHSHEHRVGLTPFGVARLKELGCEVLVQHDAGRDSHFTSEDYVAAGAAIVYQAEEIFGRADLVCKMGRLTTAEARLMRQGTGVIGFMHLVVMPAETIEAVEEAQATVIGYETVEDEDGGHPVLSALSEIAGQMAVHRAADLLEHESGGRGIVLGNVPGIPPPTVVVLGAGTAGWTAARTALACGAHVIVMDAEMARLRHAIRHGCANAVTALASPRNLSRFVPIADVVIGAVLIPGTRAPFVVAEGLVKAMKPGSVILDLSIDQGGCVATSRPTTCGSPTFKCHGVTHFCVPTMTTNVPRTASRATTLAALPFLTQIAGEGLSQALRSNPGLACGVYVYRGKLVHEPAARALGMSAARLTDLLSP
jgi:alanine dehydrogenase